jgi:hypothetical protein
VRRCTSGGGGSRADPRRVFGLAMMGSGGMTWWHSWTPPMGGGRGVITRVMQPPVAGAPSIAVDLADFASRPGAIPTGSSDLGICG